MRIISKLLGATLALAALAGPASAATEWVMATGYPDSNFFTKNIKMFIDEVEKKSGGDLKITLHSNDTLIKHDNIKRAVQAGQIQIGEVRLGVYGNEDPMYILSGVPFVASTYDEAWTLKNEQKPYFDKLFSKNGMRVLYYGPWPGQGFYTKTPVATVDDFKGKKLRIYSTATQKMGEMLGFQATILPFAEVPQAFSTGLIEALFTSPQTGIDVQAWDNTKYFTMAGAIYSKNAVIVNERAWRQLPAPVQEAVGAAATAAEKRAWEMSAATTDEQMKILAGNGMTVQNAPAPIIAKMKEIGKVMVEDWKKTASPEAIAVLDAYYAKQK